MDSACFFEGKSVFGLDVEEVERYAESGSDLEGARCLTTADLRLVLIGPRRNLFVGINVIVWGQFDSFFAKWLFGCLLISA